VVLIILNIAYYCDLFDFEEKTVTHLFRTTAMNSTLYRGNVIHYTYRF